MTPWEDEKGRPRYAPVGGVRGLLLAAQAAFEWALLASFQADLKLFHRTNEVIRLTIENRRLQAENAELKSRLRGQLPPSPPAQIGAPDLQHKEIQPPVIVSPQRPIPLVEIIRYDRNNHERLYQMGYEDAKAAWTRAGRRVEGQS